MDRDQHLGEFSHTASLVLHRISGSLRRAASASVRQRTESDVIPGDERYRTQSPKCAYTANKMDKPAHDPRDNHILDALPALERERLFPHLKLTPMPLGMVLY